MSELNIASAPNLGHSVTPPTEPVLESTPERAADVAVRPSSPVTQQDIATRLGVSQRLVSYALNGTGTVSEVMRAKVRREAQLLGYRPNKAARALKSGRTQLIALYVPNLESSYGMRILSLLRGLAEESSYDLVIVGTKTKILDSWPLDGFLHLDPRPSETMFDGTTSIPEIAMGCYPHLAPEGQDYTGLNLYAGTEEAMRHLLERNPKRMLFLSGYGLLTEQEPRAEIYTRLMEEYGKTPERAFIEGSELVREHSSRLIQSYIAEKGVPDAIFCSNDEMAVGVCRALRTLKLRVPEDVRIVGCDGTSDAADHDPPLSTIEFPYEEMCRQAWEMLLRRIEEPNLPTQRITLPTKLIIRDSSR